MDNVCYLEKIKLKFVYLLSNLFPYGFNSKKKNILKDSRKYHKLFFLNVVKELKGMCDSKKVSVKIYIRHSFSSISNSISNTIVYIFLNRSGRYYKVS